MNNNPLFRFVLTSVFCALIFTATFIAIPAPTVGNINLGDCLIILCACLLGGAPAVFAGAIGAALCDLASGYAIYAPGTLVIKALMVLVVLVARKRILRHPSPLILAFSGVLAELVMVLGYFTYDALCLGYGFGAIMNIPFNAVQAAVNVVAAVLLWGVLKKAGLVKQITETTHR